MVRRFPGVPFLHAAASAAVGFSIYFSIGVVADRGLGLTPLIFLAAGLMFALTSLSYVEGGAMLRSAVAPRPSRATRSMSWSASSPVGRS